MMYGHSRISRFHRPGRPAHVGQLRNFEPHHLGFDARDYFDCSMGVVFGDPRKYRSSSALAAGSNVTLMYATSGTA